MTRKNEYVLARRDLEEEYGPNNCYWRLAVNKREALWGLEDLGWDDEPDFITLTAKEKKKRDKLPPKEREMWDIWRRIMWRAENFRRYMN